MSVFCMSNLSKEIVKNKLTSLNCDAILSYIKITRGDKMANMKGEKKMTRTTYSIPEDLLVRVRLQTVREKRSMSDLIRVLLEDYLKKVEGKKHV